MKSLADDHWLLRCEEGRGFWSRLPQVKKKKNSEDIEVAGLTSVVVASIEHRTGR